MLNIAWAFVCIILYSCSSGPTEEEIRTMALLRCEATRLKNERFTLADSIHTLEETNPTAADQVEKMQYRGEKLKEKSLILADTIQVRLNDLFTRRFTTREKRNLFLQQVEKKILEMKCE